MASLKQLAGQTVWYGFSNIAARLLTYLLTPYLTYTLIGDRGQLEFGRYTFIYACLPFLNVLYTYGMETAYFRYSSTEDQQKLYRTQISSMLASTLMFSALLLIFREPLAAFANISAHPEYIGWCAAIIGLDAISALPYARLRRENRPRKYAATKVAGILVFVLTIVGLFSLGGQFAEQNPDSFFASWYNQHWGLGFILFANILQALVTLLLLVKELADVRLQLDKALFKKTLVYGLPILVAGFAGTINDTLNRVMFQKLYPASENESLRMVGIYTAAVRLSVLITLSIQAFKMAAEPFFFSISQEKNAPATYARVMKWFVILLGGMFLGIVLYIDVWKYFVGPEYRDALGLVPVLLISNIFLGIYYNLTVWYKLTDKTYLGAYIMLIGSVITVAFNWFLVPTWGYAACAWGTLACYGTMMVLSYAWGQKYYPIPYATGKLLGYLGYALVLFFLNTGISNIVDSPVLRIGIGTVLIVLFIMLVVRKEKEELKRFPFIGKFIR